MRFCDAVGLTVTTFNDGEEFNTVGLKVVNVQSSDGSEVVFWIVNRSTP